MQPEKLVHSDRTDRYLEELNHHAADAGDERVLGSPHELRETFNAYARPKRNFKIALIVLFGLYIFVTNQLVLNGENVWDNNAIEPTMLERISEVSPVLGALAGYALFTGILFHIPAWFFILFIHLYVDTFENGDGFGNWWMYQTYFFLAPFFSAFFWSGIVALFTFKPEWLKRKLNRKKTYEHR